MARTSRVLRGVNFQVPSTRACKRRAFWGQTQGKNQATIDAMLRWRVNVVPFR